jgi:hypothetical protein
MGSPSSDSDFRGYHPGSHASVLALAARTAMATSRGGAADTSRSDPLAGGGVTSGAETSVASKGRQFESACADSSFRDRAAERPIKEFWLGLFYNASLFNFGYSLTLQLPRFTVAHSRFTRSG